MWDIDNETLTEITIPIIREHFPSYDAVMTRRDKSGEFQVKICMSESDYIADLLSSDLDLNDVAYRIMKEIIDLGYSKEVVHVKRTTSIHEWDSVEMKRLALGC